MRPAPPRFHFTPPLTPYTLAGTLPYMTRVCCKCHIRKSLAEFPRRGDGRYLNHHHECKACRNAYKRGRPAEVKRAERQAWRKRHPEQRGAHRTVAKAVKAGRLVRPELCEDCGQPGQIQAHHDDYSKRLVVRWLCHACHIEAHVQLRREARDAQAA